MSNRGPWVCLFSSLGEASHSAALAEFFPKAIFVFAGQGSTMAIKKITDDGPVCVSGLPVSVLAHAFSLSVAISAGANISGGRVNPAGTFIAFICEKMTLLRSITYWIAQLLGSVVARVLLKPAAGNAFSISAHVSRKSALVVMTFGLVYSVYATAIEPRKSSVRVLAPMAIGCIMGANILVGGAFVGASKSLALAFGPAVVSWNWADHLVYWVGPILVVALAALLFATFFVIESSGDHFPTVEY